MKQDQIIESILDLNANNVWKLSAQDIRKAWNDEKEEGSFSSSEDKLLNTIRLNFEVVHYNPNDPREKARYENGEWETFQHCNEKKGWVAIRRKHITSLNDLSYENIRQISAAMLLELIERNFGGGWDSISLSMKDIILSSFDISTTTLPASRIHAAGGTLERKVAQGFEVLEITKGTWVEAIFAKKKESVGKVRLGEDRYDEDGNLRRTAQADSDGDDEDLPDELVDDDDLNDDETDEDKEGRDLDDDSMDEMYYSSISEGVSDRDIEGDEEYAGLSIEDEGGDMED